MASSRKRKAARKNALNTRPSTNPDLRRKVSLNALQHGFSANTFVLSNEERPLYDELLQGFIHDLQPANTIEMECIYDMVGAKWRLRRMLSVESDIFDMQINQQKPTVEQRPGFTESSRTAVAFDALANDGNTIHLLIRYQAHLRRTFDKALQNFMMLKRKVSAPDSPFLRGGVRHLSSTEHPDSSEPKAQSPISETAEPPNQELPNGATERKVSAPDSPSSRGGVRHLSSTEHPDSSDPKPQSPISETAEAANQELPNGATEQKVSAPGSPSSRGGVRHLTSTEHPNSSDPKPQSPISETSEAANQELPNGATEQKVSAPGSPSSRGGVRHLTSTEHPNSSDPKPQSPISETSEAANQELPNGATEQKVSAPGSPSSRGGVRHLSSTEHPNSSDPKPQSPISETSEPPNQELPNGATEQKVSAPGSPSSRGGVRHLSSTEHPNSSDPKPQSPISETSEPPNQELPNGATEQKVSAPGSPSSRGGVRHLTSTEHPNSSDPKPQSPISETSEAANQELPNGANERKVSAPGSPSLRGGVRHLSSTEHPNSTNFRNLNPTSFQRHAL